MKPYYQDSACTIYHGDCREILPIIPKCGLILTDPPFSDKPHNNAKSNRGNGTGVKAIDFKAIDFKAILEFLDQCGAICDRWLVSCMDWRHIAAIEKDCPEAWEFVRFGVWVKTNPMPQISSDRPANGWDGIAYLHKREVKKEWSGGGSHGNWIGPVITDGLHPTQKPIGWFRQIVERHSKSDSIVLDPFMGSGTTLRAAKDIGRKAIGIELEERYCEIAARRMEQEVLPLTTEQPKQPIAQELFT